MSGEGRLYVETSAILSVAFSEPGFDVIVGHLREFDGHDASRLTLVEVDRVIARIEAAHPADAAEAVAVRSRVFGRCAIVPLHEEILARAGARFPVEPVRTLDAVHLATAEWLRREAGPVTVLSLDERVRKNAVLLGFRVLPDLVG